MAWYLHRVSSQDAAITTACAFKYVIDTFISERRRRKLVECYIARSSTDLLVRSDTSYF